MKTKLLFTLFFLIKLSSYSQQVWERQYNEKIANTFTQTFDNKFILAGAEYESMFQKWNIFTADSLGFAEWETTFHSYGYGIPTDIKTLPDSGYIIFGIDEGQLYNLRYNKYNQLISEKHIKFNDTISVDELTSVTKANNDSLFIIIGNTHSTASINRPFVAKINNNGESIWTKLYNTEAFSHFISITKNNDSTYFCIGTLNNKIWLLKINDYGDTLWTKILDNYTFYPKTILKTNDNNILINGTKNNNIFFVKTDLNGNELWNKTYINNYNVESISIAKTFDNGFIVANKIFHNYDYFATWIIKLNSEGDTIWSITTPEQNIPQKIIQTKDSLYAILLNIYGITKLAKFDSLNGNIVTNINYNFTKEKNRINNYPNPFNEETIIIWNKNKEYNKAILTITDVVGNIIINKIIINENKFYFRKPDLKSGIYFYNLKVNDKIISGKMIKK